MKKKKHLLFRCVVSIAIKYVLITCFFLSLRILIYNLVFISCRLVFCMLENEHT